MFDLDESVNEEDFFNIIELLQEELISIDQIIDELMAHEIKRFLGLE